MRGRRRCAMRAAVLGVLGVFAVAPGAHAATCVRSGAPPDAIATVTFAAADGTVTVSVDDAGALRVTAAGGAPQACAPAATLANLAQVNVVGSAAADTLVLDLATGLLARPSDDVLVAVDAALAGGSDALDVRLPDEDNEVFGGTLGADLDGDAAPDVTWAATERLAMTGLAGDDDLEFGGDGADLGDPLDLPIALAGGGGDDTLRGGAAADTFAGGPGEDVVTYDDRTAAVGASLNGLADDGAAGEGDRIGTDVEDLTGGSANDALTGDLRDNILDAGPGNDAVSGGRGADTLTGGAGNDTVAGGDGDDSLDEAAPANGTDVLSGGDGSDTVDYSGRTKAVTVLFDGKAGNGEAGEGDTVASDIEGATGGAGNDTLTGTGADDTLDGAAGNDAVNGGAGADTITGGAGSDTLDGGPGDDTIDPGAGDDTARGGAGDDEIDQPGSALGLDDVADGSDVVDGGDGFDTASYAGRTLPVALSLDGLRNDGQANELDHLLAFEAVVGGQASDALQGGAGDDTLTPGPGDDTVAGGAGEDAVDYSDRTQPVIVTLGAAGAGGVAGERDAIAADVEDATGGAGNDTLIGTNGDNYLVAGRGNDIVTGLGGDDDLDGGDGADSLDGGPGEDTADYSTAFHGFDLPGVVADLARGTATSFDEGGAAAVDTLKGFEHLLGSGYADTLTGNSRANTLDGGLGDDVLVGGAGPDDIRGGAGDDRLAGGNGADDLAGADGDDTLNGGAGADELGGGADDDSLSGAAGADRLAGGGGDDTLAGGAGGDALAGGPGDDREAGGAGRDRFDQGPFSDGGDRLDGGPGTDVVDYRGRSARLTVTLGRGADDGARGEGDNLLRTIEIVFAGSGADRLTAGVRRAVLYGGGGNDVLTGGAGADYLDGGGGSDTARRVRAGDRVVSCRTA